MSGLRSAIDELACDDLECVPDRVLLDEVAELSRDIVALEAQRLRRVAAIDRRLAYEQDGALTPDGVAPQSVRVACRDCQGSVAAGPWSSACSGRSHGIPGR